jgi:acid phosphatase family membrane protein YuiD
MRRRRTGGTVYWKLAVPAELALKIESLVYDKVAKRPDYGARARLLNKLLEDFWNQLDDETKANALNLR